MYTEAACPANPMRPGPRNSLIRRCCTADRATAFKRRKDKPKVDYKFTVSFLLHGVKIQPRLPDITWIHTFTHSQQQNGLPCADFHETHNGELYKWQTEVLYAPQHSDTPSPSFPAPNSDHGERKMYREFGQNFIRAHNEITIFIESIFTKLMTVLRPLFAKQALFQRI